MTSDMHKLSPHIQQSWADLLSEEAELKNSITEHQKAISDHEVAIEENSERLGTLAQYKSTFFNFHMRGNLKSDPKPVLKPGGACPIPLDRKLTYQAALEAIGAATPGGYLHHRTSAVWLMEAEIIKGLSLNQARMRVSKYLSRSRNWEKVEGHRGWFRLNRVSSEQEIPAPGENDTPAQAERKLGNNERENHLRHE